MDKCFARFVLLAGFIFSLCSLCQASNSCKIDFDKIGCFKDDQNPRPLGELLVTARDPSSDKYDADTNFKWADLEGSLRRLICSCAKKAREKRYKYIGIQYYAECWSDEISKNYAKDGESNQCVQHWSTFSDPNPCKVTDPDDCTGKADTNFVYRLLECWEMVDIGILLDVSSSMGSLNAMINAKAFLTSLVLNLKVSHPGTHIGLITFASEAQKVFQFDSTKSSNPIEIVNVINEITVQQGITLPDKALDLSNTELFVENAGMRPNVSKILITVTDGTISQYAQPYYLFMDPLESKGVTLMSVGVGSDVYEAEVRALARNNPQNVFDGNLGDSAAKNVADRVKELALAACNEVSGSGAGMG